jgi:hypothetical protein
MRLLSFREQSKVKGTGQECPLHTSMVETGKKDRKDVMG